ncbi:MAG: pilin [Candidatus Nealsonbacteria bacterium]|nr:MAG: TrbC/VirB2 family protein [Candidatus Nealsonbacteria bacterium]
MKNKRLLVTILSILFFLSLANQVLAICGGPLVPCGRPGKPACSLCHIFELLNNILKFFLTCLVPIVAGLILVIGGMMFMFAYFSEPEMLAGEKKGGPVLLSQAKKTITAVVIGVVIIFSSWVFLNAFLGAIGIAKWTGLGTWWEIKCAPPVYCEQCSDCSSGEYCKESIHTCSDLPACAECNSGFGYNRQENGEDLWGDCSICHACSGLDTGPEECVPITDNTQDDGCDGTCQACQSGLCGNATAGTNPGGKCWPDPEYRNGGGPNLSFCQSRTKDGKCNDSGSCNDVYGPWVNINEGLPCSGSYGCEGNTFYAPTTCSSGTCSGGSVDIGCCACSKCSSGKYCKKSNHTCTDLRTCAECNSGFGYNRQENNEDKWHECSQGSTASDGCSSEYCSGTYYSCGVQSSGDGGCPICYTCKDDNNIDCEFHSEGFRDSGCSSCKLCNGVGSCIKNSPDSGWGAGSYGCTAYNQRCFEGECKKCSSRTGGGYLYSANCPADEPKCGGEGGMGCWYKGGLVNPPWDNRGELCKDVCATHGGCVDANWDDNDKCKVCRKFFGDSARCTPDSAVVCGSWAPFWANIWGDMNHCYGRKSSIDQSCKSSPGSYSWRICVCNY